jgi:hypothetical protein
MYLLAVNLEARSVSASFVFPGIDGADAVVLFENRVVKIAGGRLAAHFAPHQRHVYRCTLPEVRP